MINMHAFSQVRQDQYVNCKQKMLFFQENKKRDHRVHEELLIIAVGTVEFILGCLH